jgi:hypothetical protein
VGVSLWRCRLRPFARAGQGKEWEDRKSAGLPKGEREGVRAHHEARRFATPKRLLESSTRITIIGGHWLPAVITLLLDSPVTPHHRGLISLTVGISSSLLRSRIVGHAYIRQHEGDGHEQWVWPETPCM